MKRIQYILRLDHRDHDKEPFSHTEYLMAYSIIAGMSDEEYSLLKDQLVSNSPIPSIRQEVLDNKEDRNYHTLIRREDYEPLHKTEPFDCLLKWTAERKKGKLAYAKGILTEHFEGYSDSQQKKILKVLLQQAPGDRRFACRKLYTRWDDQMIPDVLQCWSSFHDDVCGWLIIRAFPLDMVKEMAMELATPRNVYTLCKRLGTDMPFYPETTLFSPNISIVGYLDAVSHTQYAIAAEKAEELLYRIVSVAMYGLISDHEFMGRYNGWIKQLPDGTPATTKHFFKIRKLDVTEIDDIKDSIVYLCKMGHTEVVERFLEWNASIIEHYNRLIKLSEDKEMPYQSDAVALLLYLFPEKYRGSLDYSEWMEYSWLSLSRWHILLNRRKRELQEFPTTVNFDSIRKLSPEDFAEQPIRHVAISNDEGSGLRELSGEEALGFLSKHPSMEPLVNHLGLEVINDSEPFDVPF